MGISKYPRSGQRIAPSTLVDILTAAPPTGVLSNGSYARFADIDETVWKSNSAYECGLMGDRLVNEVKQNINHLPWEIKFRTLSLFTKKIPLCDLDLELRTFNALKRRFGQNVPPETLIRDLLTIAGFGVRCLVDFLASIEHYGNQPVVTEQLELAVPTETTPKLSPEEFPAKIEVEISHYPRQGHRIAPRALKDILNIPVKDRRMAHTFLCNLDESAWENYSPEICQKLALAVVKCTSDFRTVLSKEGGRIKIPVPKTNGKPIFLQLEQRTFNCLNSRGLLDNPVRLAEMTVADLITMAGFGVKSLVDLLTALETQVSESFAPNSEVLEIAQRLSRLKEVEELRIDDPRFGLALQALRMT